VRARKQYGARAAGLIQGMRASQPVLAAAALVAADAQAADAKRGPLSSCGTSAWVHRG
jgi:hypothetical protein